MYLTNALKNPKQDCLVVEAIRWWPRQNAKRFAMCKWLVMQMSHQISYSARNASRINTGRSVWWRFAVCGALIFPQLSRSHLPPHEILCFKAIRSPMPFGKLAEESSICIHWCENTLWFHWQWEELIRRHHVSDHESDFAPFDFSSRNYTLLNYYGAIILILYTLYNIQNFGETTESIVPVLFMICT